MSTSNTSPQIEAIAAQARRKIVSRFALIGVVLFVPAILSGIFYFHANKSEIIMSSFGGYFNQVVKTNDYFELSRQFHSLVSNKDFSGAWYFDSDNELKLHVKDNESILDPDIKFQGDTSIGLNGINPLIYSWHKMNDESTNGKTTFVVASEVPLWIILILLFGFSLTMVIFSSILRRQLSGLGEKLSGPICDFSENLRNIKRIEDIDDLPQAYGVYEIDNITSEISNLALRLKRSEEQVHRNEAMAKIGKLSQMIFHSAKRPIQLFRMSIEQIKAIHSPADKLRLLEYATPEIDESLDALEATVNELMNADTITAVSRRAVDIAEVFNQVAKKRPGLNKIKGYSVNQNSKNLQRVEVDETKLHHSLLCLVDNALEAVNPDGKIEVSITSVDKYTEFSIYNTGKYIPQEDLSEVFSRRYTRGKINGTGHGLAFVAEMAKSCGGKLGCESSKNSGTRFWIKIPNYQSSLDYKLFSLSRQQNNNVISLPIH